ncbi:MAG TPA: hypothetical protein DEP28_08435 [Bacteroidetes bacterium]|nr:hypothetical protein [Bacteroidota bacterium]HCN38430.1 hypothetical protein [Bacteroidota bacterium]
MKSEIKKINQTKKIFYFIIFHFLIFSYVKNLSSQDFQTSGLNGMFNERGYNKSSTLSVDENEIINDYNGNLNFSFPLHQIKGPGDININMTLNYNGSMSSK